MVEQLVEVSRPECLCWASVPAQSIEPVCGAPPFALWSSVRAPASDEAFVANGQHILGVVSFYIPNRLYLKNFLFGILCVYVFVVLYSLSALDLLDCVFVCLALSWLGRGN